MAILKPIAELRSVSRFTSVWTQRDLRRLSSKGSGEVRCHWPGLVTCCRCSWACPGVMALCSHWSITCPVWCSEWSGRWLIHKRQRRTAPRATVRQATSPRSPAARFSGRVPAVWWFYYAARSPPSSAAPPTWSRSFRGSEKAQTMKSREGVAEETPDPGLRGSGGMGLWTRWLGSETAPNQKMLHGFFSVSVP